MTPSDRSSRGCGPKQRPLPDRNSPTSRRSRMIEETIEREIRPSLKKDGGDIELVDVIGNRVLVATRGTCATCKAADITLETFCRIKAPGFRIA